MQPIYNGTGRESSRSCIQRSSRLWSGVSSKEDCPPSVPAQGIRARDKRSVMKGRRSQFCSSVSTGAYLPLGNSDSVQQTTASTGRKVGQIRGQLGRGYLHSLGAPSHPRILMIRRIALGDDAVSVSHLKWKTGRHQLLRAPIIAATTQKTTS